LRIKSSVSYYLELNFYFFIYKLREETTIVSLIVELFSFLMDYKEKVKDFNKKITILLNNFLKRNFSSTKITI
jgi:hypothetical protein